MTVFLTLNAVVHTLFAIALGSAIPESIDESGWSGSVVMIAFTLASVLLAAYSILHA